VYWRLRQYTIFIDGLIISLI